MAVPLPRMGSHPQPTRWQVIDMSSPTTGDRRAAPASGVVAARHPEPRVPAAFVAPVACDMLNSGGQYGGDLHVSRH